MKKLNNRPAENNLIFEAYQQINEAFRDEAHIAKEPSRQSARIWFREMKNPGPRTFPEGESPIPYLQKTVKEFLTNFSKQEDFNVQQGANEMHYLIDEEFGIEIASEVFRPLKGLIEMLIGPSPERKAIDRGEAAQRRYPKDDTRLPQQQHPDFEPELPER